MQRRRLADAMRSSAAEVTGPVVPEKVTAPETSALAVAVLVPETSTLAEAGLALMQQALHFAVYLLLLAPGIPSMP